MARTRSIRIRESLEELEQLRRYHKGTPQERRILFLSFLKEDRKRTIPESARKSGISDRRGRRWWDAYREGGLSKLLDLRIWKIEELEPTSLDSHISGTSNSTDISNPSTPGIDFLAFLIAVASLAEISDSGKWARTLGDLLASFFSEIDYAVVQVKTGIDLTKSSRDFVFHQNVASTGEIDHEVGSVRDKKHKYVYEELIEQGKRRKFPFKQYHFPPAGYDLFVRPTNANNDVKVHIGSFLLFRDKSQDPFTQETVDLVERLRPFLTFLFTDFIYRAKSEKPGADLFNEAVTRVAGDVGLSPREQDVLLLEMLGHSYDQIGQFLNISPKTVQSHVRSVYQKAGVNRLSEFFARYFTPRELFPEKKTT